MAARMRKTHQDDVRAKIQCDRIVAWMQAGLFGTKFQGKPVDLTSEKVSAAKALLNKRLPDLSQVSGPGENGEHKLEFTWRA